MQFCANQHVDAILSFNKFILAGGGPGPLFVEIVMRDNPTFVKKYSFLKLMPILHYILLVGCSKLLSTFLTVIW